MFNKATDKLTLITSKESLYYRGFLEKQLYKVYLKLKDKTPKKGTKAMVDSLLRGLKENNVNFVINPCNVKDVTPYVYIPAVRSVAEIKVLSKLKKQGKVKKIVIGPLGITHPDSRNKVVEHSCIDSVVVASDWMAKYISSLNKDVLKKIVVIPAGADTSFFTNTENFKDKKVLVYSKNTHYHEDTQQQEQEALNLLNKMGIEYNYLKYGSHNKDDYKNTLLKTDLSIFINQSETQGIAFAESWSMNVPTLVFDKSSDVLIVGNGIKRKLNYYKTCPYIAKENGLLFKNTKELENILKEYKDNKDCFLKQFTPRKWLENNITDKLYAEKIINLF